jgi:hypothetical protein
VLGSVIPDPTATVIDVRQLIKDRAADHIRSKIDLGSFPEELTEKIDNPDKWLPAGGFLPAGCDG